MINTEALIKFLGENGIIVTESGALCTYGTTYDKKWLYTEQNDNKWTVEEGWEDIEYNHDTHYSCNDLEEALLAFAVAFLHHIDFCQIPDEKLISYERLYNEALPRDKEKLRKAINSMEGDKEVEKFSSVDKLRKDMSVFNIFFDRVTENEKTDSSLRKKLLDLYLHGYWHSVYVEPQKYEATETVSEYLARTTGKTQQSNRASSGSVSRYLRRTLDEARKKRASSAIILPKSPRITEEKRKGDPVKVFCFSVNDRAIFFNDTVPFAKTIDENSLHEFVCEGDLPADPWFDAYEIRQKTYDDIYGNVIQYTLDEEESDIWNNTHRVPFTIYIYNPDTVYYYQEAIYRYVHTCNDEYANKKNNW